MYPFPRFDLPGNAIEAQAARHRTAQIYIVLHRLPIVVLGNMALVAAVLVTSWQSGHMPTPVEPAMISVTQDGLVLLGLPRLKSPVRPLPDWMVWLLTAYALQAAILNAWLAYDVLVDADAIRRSLVIGAACGMIGLGSWLMAPLRHAALAWITSATFSMAIVLYATEGRSSANLILLFVIFGALLAAVVLVTENEFLHRLRTADSLAEQNEIIALLLHDFERDASDWPWEVGCDGRLSHIPDRLRCILQGKHLQPEDISFLQILNVLAGAENSGSRHLAEMFAAGEPFKDALIHVNFDGALRWWSLRGSPIVDREGRSKGWRGVGSDVTVARERDELLLRQAREDALTGLANRYHLEEELAARCKVEPVVLLILDLDNFKQVNDTLGHHAGDRLLKQVARRLDALRPAHSVLARQGGDEFAFVWSGDTQAEVAEFATNILRVLHEPISLDEREFDVSVSIGAAFHPSDAKTADELMRAADLALYAAKEAGRGCLRFFVPELAIEATRQMTLLSDLRHAIAEDQFEVYYQPQMDFQSRQLVGFEALVRWRHPSHGLVPPADFIPLAESSGLILQIDRWVLNCACREAAKWPAPLRLAVNVSMQKVERGNLKATVPEALRTSGLPAERLMLEITETSLLHNRDATVDLLSWLRSRGVSIAVDDFGTGFSSLAYLQTLPIDEIKIDRSFVTPLNVPGDQERAKTLIECIQRLATALNLKTVAEGVETDIQYTFLGELGCDLLQGYWLSRPLDAEATRRFIASFQSRS